MSANLDAFFNAADELAVQTTASLGERLELPCAVVHPAARAALGRALGLDDAQIEAILSGGAGIERGEGGQVSTIGESDFYERKPEGDFELLTCADALASLAPGFVLRSVPIEAERAARVRGERLASPVDEVDTHYVGLLEQAKYAAHLIELNAPGILVRSVKAKLQSAFDSLVALRSGKPAPERWEGYDQLMTGAPASPLCHEPQAIFAIDRVSNPAAPRDCFVLRSGFLVMFPWGSVVLGPDGELRDWFATRGLRPVGDDGTSIVFVGGGGPTARSGYFSPTPIVRDVGARRWLTGPLPPGLPRYVAGTIGDVRWAIVADLYRALGAHISPGWMGDQCGSTITSVDNAHAYDGGFFVIECATGRRVLDMRNRVGEVVSFVRRADGHWRLLMAPGDDFDDDDDENEDEAAEADEANIEAEPPCLRVVDESGAELHRLPTDATTAVLSPDGESLLWASPEELRLVDLESGRGRLALDLRPLVPLLSAPLGVKDADLFCGLLASFGFAGHVAEQTPESARAALAESYYFGRVDDQSLADAIAVAGACPTPATLPRLPKLG